jgi:hypothetical protein
LWCSISVRKILAFKVKVSNPFRHILRRAMAGLSIELSFLT